MALTQLAPPYPIFTDKNGDPLDNGYLYFGEVNKNPETNPIQVYYDSALTQPAAQPLRTSNGYVMRNGSPALIYADSQFSVTIRDKNNALVIYSPVGYGIDPGSISGTVVYDDFTGDGATVNFTLSASPSTKNATNVYIDGVYQSKENYSTNGSTLTFTTAPPINSAIEVVTQESSIIGGASSQQITYTQGSAGSVTRTVQSRLRDFVSVKDFGAVGDGVTDDTAAIQAAIDTLPHGGTLYFPEGEFLISSTLTCFTSGAYLIGTAADPAETSYVVGSVIKKSGDFDGLVCSGYNIKVSDLSIIGQTRSKGSGAGVGHGLVIAGRGCSVERVVGRYNGGCGVLINAEDASGTPDAENSHWVQLVNGFTEYNGQSGVKFDSPTSGKMNMNLVLNWTSRHNDGDGYHNAAGSYMEYENADAEYNLGYGIRFSKGSYSTLVSCHTEQNEGGNGSIDAGDGVRIEDGVIQVRFFGGTYSEGGGGSNFEAGISYDPASTQQDRDLRAMGVFYKNKYITPTSTTNGLKDLHFQAHNYRAVTDSVAGYSAYVTPTAGLELSAAFYAQRINASAIRGKIAVGKNGTDQEKGGVEVASFYPDPTSNQTAMMLLVNNGGTISMQQVTIGAADSGGTGYRVLRVPN